MIGGAANTFDIPCPQTPVKNRVRVRVSFRVGFVIGNVIGGAAGTVDP